MLGVGLGLGFQSSKAFNPKEIANLLGWYRADQGVTLVSGLVSAWADISGSGDAGRNLAQATAGLRPTPVASDSRLGGAPAISFPRANDILQSGSWSPAVVFPSTMYLVGYQTSPIIGLMIDGVDTSNRQYLYVSSDHEYSMGTSGSADATGSAGGTNAVANPHVICANFAASGAIYIDDSQTAKGSGVMTSKNPPGISVGNVENDAGLTYNGSIGEVLIYGGSHDAATRKRVFAYLGGRYGVAVT